MVPPAAGPALSFSGVNRIRPARSGLPSLVLTLPETAMRPSVSTPHPAVSRAGNTPQIVKSTIRCMSFSSTGTLRHGEVWTFSCVAEFIEVFRLELDNLPAVA